MKRLLTLLAAVALLATTAVAAGCGPTDADVAAKNLSTAAEQFEIARRIVAVNGITDTYLLEVEGYCSLETADSGLAGTAAVICKVGEDEHGNALVKKSYVYLSDNVTFVVQQVDPAAVSTNHYRFIFKPEAIVPDIDRP